jgi:hypothetical protein
MAEKDERGHYKNFINSTVLRKVLSEEFSGNGINVEIEDGHVGYYLMGPRGRNGEEIAKEKLGEGDAGHPPYKVVLDRIKYIDRELFLESFQADSHLYPGRKDRGYVAFKKLPGKPSVRPHHHDLHGVKRT